MKFASEQILWVCNLLYLFKQCLYNITTKIVLDLDAWYICTFYYLFLRKQVHKSCPGNLGMFESSLLGACRAGRPKIILKMFFK